MALAACGEARHTTPAGKEPAPALETGSAVWESAAGCAAALAAGERLAREPGTIRLATWNLRWFPRGCPPDQECPEQATDHAWLACGLAWMQVDVLGFQEVLRSDAGTRGLRDLTRALDEHTGGRWESDLQSCGGSDAQGVGYLWDASRVALEERQDLWELNGDRGAHAGDACAARLRPGRFARLRSTAGLDASLVNLHLDSGRRALDWERRRRALARLPEARAGDRTIVELDEDLVALGDFNSMGRSQPSAVEPGEEIAGLAGELPGLRPATPEARCSGYYVAEPGRLARTLLDHFFPAMAMREAGAAAFVSGFCASLGCPDALRGDPPAAWEQLSDHCPVLLDLEDRELDAG